MQRRPSRRAHVAPVAFACVFLTAAIQAAADPSIAYEVRRAAAKIAIDGVAESGWESAPWISSFAAPGGVGTAADTRARLLWDGDSLYFLAELRDADIVAASRLHDDRLWRGDVFELFFKPEPGPGYYELQVNPANARLDMYLPRRAADAYERWRSSRPFLWETAVRVSASGWVVEGRIPWGDFAPTGGRPRAGDAWRFALCRYDYTDGAEPVLTSNARLTRPDFHRSEEWVELRFSIE